jgi:hypothetical protein
MASDHSDHREKIGLLLLLRPKSLFIKQRIQFETFLIMETMNGHLVNIFNIIHLTKIMIQHKPKIVNCHFDGFRTIISIFIF